MTPKYRTSTGAIIYLDDPERSDVRLTDIAIALSRQTRFGGHTAAHVEHYSVAQHSVIVSRRVPPECALPALLHDAPEAYLQDIVRPTHEFLGDRYWSLMLQWAHHLGEMFGIGEQLRELPPEVAAADNALLEQEKHWLCYPATPSDGIPDDLVPLDSRAARGLFLRRFAEVLIVVEALAGAHPAGVERPPSLAHSTPGVAPPPRDRGAPLGGRVR